MTTEQEHVQHDSEREQRLKTFSRRQLLQVGWTVPVVMAIELARPKTVFAQGSSHIDYTDYNDHNDGHGDDGHYDKFQDSPYHNHADGNQHKDSPSHHDYADGNQHKDTPYSDHGDHTDAHDDTHLDHTDHTDTLSAVTHADTGSVVRMMHGVASHDDHLDHLDSS